jgi:hypothetical protein
MIRLQCPHCDKKLTVNDDLAGRVGLCPGCKRRIQIPQAEPTETEDAADAAIAAAPRPSRRPPPEKTRRPAEDEDEDDEKPVRRARRPADEEDEDEKPVKRSRRPAADEDEDEDEDEGVSHRRQRAAADEEERPRRRRRPAEEEDEEDEEPVRRSRRTADEEEDEDEKPVKRLRRPAADDDEDEDEGVSRRRRRAAADEEERPRRRTPRRKKKRRRSSSGELFGGVSTPLGVVLGVVGLCLVLAVVAIFVPAVALVPVGLGALLTLVGGVWFLIVAFSDSAVQGLLCLLIPFYNLYYLITHFEECKQPFFLQLIGVGMITVGNCAGGIGAARQGIPQMPPPDFRRRLQAPAAPVGPSLTHLGFRLRSGCSSPTFASTVDSAAGTPFASSCRTCFASALPSISNTSRRDERVGSRIEV